MDEKEKYDSLYEDKIVTLLVLPKHDSRIHLERLNYQMEAWMI